MVWRVCLSTKLVQRDWIVVMHDVSSVWHCNTFRWLLLPYEMLQEVRGQRTSEKCHHACIQCWACVLITPSKVFQLHQWMWCHYERPNWNWAGKNIWVSTWWYRGPGTKSLYRIPESQCKQISIAHFDNLMLLSIIITLGHEWWIKKMINNFRKKVFWESINKYCFPSCFFDFCTSLVATLGWPLELWCCKHARPEKCSQKKGCFWG